MIALQRLTIVILIAFAATPAVLRAQEPTEPAPRPIPVPEARGTEPDNSPPAVDTASAPSPAYPGRAPPPAYPGRAPEVGTSQEINQGTVTIRAEGESRMTIYREGVRVGTTPRTLKQREGTKHWYEVRDGKGTLICADTIAIDEPYQRVDRLCRRGSRHMTEPPAQPQ